MKRAAMRFLLLFALLLCIDRPLVAQNFDVVTPTETASIVYATGGKALDSIVANLLAGDIEAITGRRPRVTDKLATVRGRAILIGTVNANLIRSVKQAHFGGLKHQWECFSHRVVQRPFKNISQALVIAGSDVRGLAYGVFALSEKIGVSPWYWWADVAPQKKAQLSVNIPPVTSSPPSVKFRGIFLNDEDWGLQPWAAKTFEPQTGDIGPKTYAKIFELLLRLKANLIWPAMHPSTKAFFHYPGNLKAAEDYQIVIGSSHAEPMLRNNVDEWNEKTMGPFNYITNKEKIYAYWEDRVKETKSIHAIYTLGLRGVHDSKMEGANSVAEQKAVLETVLQDQRSLLKKYINPAVENVPQAFIPYKEVQDIYDDGIELPENISLVWCDDNYGYIRHFPTKAEAARKGGNGVYYHISYWGRPHDYLWLATTHPAQVYGQMKLAYDKGARAIWVLNVGDIKPAEYLTELFLNLAWNIGSIENSKAGLEKHLFNWMKQKFGQPVAKQLVPLMQEYYRLAYIRKPEFMGGTRTEEADPQYKMVADLPFSEGQVRQRLTAYAGLSGKVAALAKTVSPPAYAAWYQLVEYPVLAAAEMNKKFLYGQLARHQKADWARSDAAYDSILSLTEKYNALNGGKWKGIMDCRPRRLAVFDKVPHATGTAPLLADKTPLYLFNGNQYRRYSGSQPLSLGLGYEGGAVTLAKGASIQFDLAATADSLTVELALAPNHPVEGRAIRYAVQLDDGPAVTVDYATRGRSEEWKQNVLRNQSIRKTKHHVAKAGKHTVKITAVDEGVIVDQLRVW